MAQAVAWGRTSLGALVFPTALWRRVWRDAAILVAAAICLARATGLAWLGASDFQAYYDADLANLYVGSAPGAANAFLYSPLFAQALEPLRWLPYSVALALWTALELGALIYLAGPWSLFLFFPLAPEWMNGNVHLVMAAAVYAGLRPRSAAMWAVPAFTKLAPAVGLLWFALRREWRTLARATGILVSLAAISIALSPDAWIGWAQMLLANVHAQSSLPGTIPIALLPRVPVALALLAFGARGNHRWTVPLACALVMPSFWVSAVFAFGIAALRLARVSDIRVTALGRHRFGSSADRRAAIAVPVTGPQR
jgi:hypothetical protein